MIVEHDLGLGVVCQVASDVVEEAQCCSFVCGFGHHKMQGQVSADGSIQSVVFWSLAGYGEVQFRCLVLPDL
jgi:hypothetical protein